MPGLATRHRTGPAALILAVSAILSRLMGLVRDKVISWQFGASGEADMYFAAFVVPDIINYLLAGGFMSITIIPLLSRSFAKDEDDAWRFFSCVFCWTLAGSILLTAFGMFAAEPLARLTAPGFAPDQWQRLAFFMRIILPAQIFFLCGACLTALLYLRRQFSIPALAPLVYNGCIIAAGLLLPVVAPVQGMTGYCAGVTVGAALGTFFLPLRIAAAGGLRLRPIWRHALMGRFLLTALPLMLGQTVIMLDEQFLRVFGSLVGDGAVSLLNYARRIAQVPVGLMGQAAAVASYPFLVSLLTQGENKRFHQTLRTALSTGLALVIPCALWMAASAWPVLCVIFQGGSFGAEETLAAAPLTRLMLAPAPFWIVYMVLVRGFYAYGDTVTPAATGTLVTLICLPVYYFWAVPAGAAGIAALSGASVSLYTLWLVGIWIRRHGKSAFAGIRGLGLRVFFCALPGAAAAWLISEYCLRELPLPPIGAACVALVAGGCVFALLFLPLSRAFTPSVWETIRRCVQGSSHVKSPLVEWQPR